MSSSSSKRVICRHAGPSNRALIGGSGADELARREGNDYLDGGDGTDTLNGGPDDDECVRGEVYESCEVIL